MRFRVGTPCSKNWDELSGEGRERYCSDCQKSVHAFDDYSSEELNRLWEESGGKVCGRLQTEAAPETRSRRAVLAGTLLTAISPLLAQEGRLVIRVVEPTKAEIPRAEVQRLNSENVPVQTILTDEQGRAKFAQLPLGSNQFKIVAPGFVAKTVTATVMANETSLEVELKVGDVWMGVMVVAPKRSILRRIFQ